MQYSGVPQCSLNICSDTRSQIRGKAATYQEQKDGVSYYGNRWSGLLNILLNRAPQLELLLFFSQCFLLIHNILILKPRFWDRNGIICIQGHTCNIILTQMLSVIKACRYTTLFFMQIQTWGPDSSLSDDYYSKPPKARSLSN